MTDIDTIYYTGRYILSGTAITLITLRIYSNLLHWAKEEKEKLLSKVGVPHSEDELQGFYLQVKQRKLPFVEPFGIIVNFVNYLTKKEINKSIKEKFNLSGKDLRLILKETST